MSNPFKSFHHAFRGLAVAFRKERSFRVQVFAAAVLVAVLINVPLANWERVVLVLVATLVLVLELINTSLERLVDLAKPRLHIFAGEVKDVMAGGVLVASVGAVIVGILILGPHLLNILRRV